ncbi:hypothetical protein OGAPHI_005669 [Ogataea philodendri]|uniref:Secreted protein n=1 Tax=Ogataea philodendri TaxID=1378263 RepID=A0A9P8NZG8_9ASCO|nr:uncharacterized protein OGAPHI_005669 [Ogataea philodendri]KAH3662417.1 hypothetical protein OGAPHI_005669 [Ogataea philodendri]
MRTRCFLMMALSIWWLSSVQSRHSTTPTARSVPVLQSTRTDFESESAFTSSGTIPGSLFRRSLPDFLDCESSGRWRSFGLQLCSRDLKVTAWSSTTR